MTTGSTARYDGLADWYDARYVAGAEPHQPGLLELLGPGSGPCLDIGCGTGRNFETIRASGRSVVGLDFSADQLRLARTRTHGPLMVADAAVLPGIRRHVGMHHVPLATYLNAFLTPALTLERFEEPDQAGVPYSLAVRARRTS